MLNPVLAAFLMILGLFAVAGGFLVAAVVIAATHERRRDRMWQTEQPESDFDRHCREAVSLADDAWADFEATPAYDDTARRFPAVASWLEARDLDDEWRRENDGRGYSR